EHLVLGRDLREVREDLELVELCGLERLIRRLVDGARVVHPLVEPEAEELVRDVVADLDVGFTGSHRILLEAARIAGRWAGRAFRRRAAPGGSRRDPRPGPRRSARARSSRGGAWPRGDGPCRSRSWAACRA